MNDSIKLVLATLATAILVFVGGEALGVNWINVQATILYFIKTIGVLFLLFSGGVATLEIAKYFRYKNRELEQLDEHRSATDALLDVSALNDIVSRAVEDALASREGSQNRGRSTPGSMLDLEEADSDSNESTKRVFGSSRLREM